MAPASLPRPVDRIERRFVGPVSIGIGVELGLHQRFQMPFDHHLGDAICDRGHAPGELHSAPINLWDRLKSPIRFIPCAASGSSF